MPVPARPSIWPMPVPQLRSWPVRAAFASPIHAPRASAARPQPAVHQASRCSRRRRNAKPSPRPPCVRTPLPLLVPAPPPAAAFFCQQPALPAPPGPRHSLAAGDPDAPGTAVPSMAAHVGCAAVATAGLTSRNLGEAFSSVRNAGPPARDHPAISVFLLLPHVHPGPVQVMAVVINRWEGGCCYCRTRYCYSRTRCCYCRTQACGSRLRAAGGSGVKGVQGSRGRVMMLRGGCA